MRKVFFQKLQEFAKNDKNIFILFGDLGAKFFGEFKKTDAERLVNVGIAEQNMVGLASGLAMSGKNVFCYSIIPFLIMRAFEQIRIDLCRDNLNVKLLGSGGGVCYGTEGVTHYGIEDIGLMRTLPNMSIVAPGDLTETKALVEKAINHQGPLYIRFGRDQEFLIYEKEINFEIGKGIIVEEGEDTCLISFGTMLYNSKIACDLLEKNGISAGLIDMHTIKPLDIDLVKECAKKYKSIFTVEDHNIIGGLGSAISEVLSESGYKGKFKRLGIKDSFCHFSGQPDYLLQKLGLDSENIANDILKEIKKN